uniref:DH domain-containing protein n=1 Tax=Leptobrachium leishanense TaxID=445787 RepID=A0A8C5QJX4_9ANUR
MDAQHHQASFSGPPSVLQHPCSKFPCPSAMTYIQEDEARHPRAISKCTKREVTSLGNMFPLKSIENHAVIQELYPLQVNHGNLMGSFNHDTTRLYRSLENLHWAAMSESQVYARYQSMGSNIDLHDKSTRYFSQSSAEKISLRSLTDVCGPSTERRAEQRDLTVPPIAKVHQWLFPTTEDKACHGDTKRELKEKLRTHSSKVVEPNRPVRPQTFQSSCWAYTPTERRTCQQCKCRMLCGKAPAEPYALSNSTDTKHCTSSFYHRTSPEHIKKEAMRRLQLRRQNSFPNLAAVYSEQESRGMVKSKTTESFKEQGSEMGRSWETESTRAGQGVKGRLYIPTFEEFKRMRSQEKDCLSKCNSSMGNVDFPSKQIPGLEGEGHSCVIPVTVDVHSHRIEATDLSGYGAKLQRMKDGLIGSALDLIKKSCITEPSAQASCDPSKTDPTPQESPAGTWPSPGGTGTASNLMPTDSKPGLCSPGCRRSSSDMSHETGETGKTPRGCRLRPHFSDPMPTDAVKRKQLELKIAAAARHHAQRRRQDRENGPVLMKANTTTSCSYGADGGYTARHSHRSRHRWSNISSLSTDSGIVGVNDDREECEAIAPRVAKPGEVERVDSGIGDAMSRKWRARVAEAAASLEAWEAHRPCTDCGERDSAMDTESRGKRRETLCLKCVTRRTERKEAVLEFVNTESSYGEDLKIMREEFYIPMQTAGLLTQEQLLVVFSNIQELIDLNEKFLEVLQEEIDQALDQGDDDLMTVCIGEVFLDFVNMLPAYQTYCLQQSTSVATLNALEKEKELLRIFLDVSQNDNTALRRMNLRSFLMAPLQRVTKYPLLLSRILKSTTEFHPDHSSLWEAKSRIESHLEHINMKTKQEGNPWTLRSFRRESRKNKELTFIEMREMAVKQLGWLREETRFIKEGPLHLAQPTDSQWVKKGCKALKFQNVQALLMVNIKRTSELGLEGSSDSQTLRDAVLVLIKDKNNGKFVMLREPVRLGHCVVSSDPDCEETFELLEIKREGFVFRDTDSDRTQQWFRQIKTYSRELGSWRKRRNALPNIMISTTQSRP